MKKGRRRWGRIIVALIVLAGAGYGVSRLISSRTSIREWCCRASSDVASPPGSTPPGPSAPAGVRIKVEVLNATTIRGLARRATLFLRDRGFDVVGTGTVRDARDSTLVLDRSGHPEWAALVAKALNARMESRPDSSRYLDVTVLLGGNWRPPPLPFYP